MRLYVYDRCGIIDSCGASQQSHLVHQQVWPISEFGTSSRVSIAKSFGVRTSSSSSSYLNNINKNLSFTFSPSVDLRI